MNSNTIQIAIEVDDKGSVKLRQIGKEATAAGDAGAKGFDKMSRSAKGAGDQSSLVASTVRSMGAAIAAAVTVEAVRRLVELADSYTRIEGRLKLVTTSTANLASVQAQLYAASQRSTASYIATAEAYARIAQNTKDLHLAQSTLVTITETLNKAFTVSGASEVERSATMIQLSQAFSAGALRGEEFNSVAEQGGRVLDLLADYLHASRGELKAMAEDGKLTSDVLINSITYGAEKVNAEFDAMPKTVSQAGTVLGNVLGSVVNDANKSTGATAGLSQAIFDLARTIEENKPAILSVFTGIVESAGWAVKQVGAMATEIKVLSAVAAGALDFTDYIKMGSTEEMAQWMTDFDHGMAGVRKEITETAAKLKELGEEDTALVDEVEFTKTQQHFDALRGQIAAYENQITGASINSQAQVKGTLELLRQKSQQEKDIAAVTAAGAGVQKLSNDALEKLQKSLTPVHQAQLQYKKDLEDIEKAHKSGQLVGAVYNEALKTAKDHLDKATGATASHKKALSESEKEAKKAAQASKAAAKEYQSILDSLEPARVEQERYNDALAALDKLDPTHQTKRYLDLLEELNKTTKEGQELEEHRAEIMGDLEDYERQVAQARMTDAERQIDDINRQTDALIKYGNELAKLDPKYQALADEGAEAFGERAHKQIEDITDEADEMGKMFEDVAGDIRGSFRDMFRDMMDDSDNAMDSIIDMFKDLVAEMATMAFKPIILQITASVGSAMGISDNAIAKTLGMDTTQLSSGGGGIGNMLQSSIIGEGYDYVSGLFSGSAASSSAAYSSASYGSSAWDLGSVYGEGAYGSAASELGSSASSSGWGGLSTAAQTGWSSGALAFVASLLSGEDVAVAAVKGVGAGGGAYLGTQAGSYFGPVGTAVGGVLGGILGALGAGSLLDNGPDTFQAGYMSDAVGVNYDAVKGMVPTTTQFTGGDTDSQIAAIYAPAMRAIQQAFDANVTALVETLPEEMSASMIDSLASMDLQAILDKVSAGEIEVGSVDSWLAKVAEGYAEGLSVALGEAFGNGLASFISAKGAEGLVGDSAAWAVLTDAVKENITASFQEAATQIAGGDIDTGLETINSVTNAIAAIESAMAPITEIIATDGLTEYEKSIRSINLQFDSYRDVLKSAGVDMEKYTDLEKARGLALEQVVNPAVEEAAAAARAMAEALSVAMTPVNEIIATSGMSDYEREIRSINQQFDDYAETVEQSGGGVFQLIRIEKARAIQLAEVVNPAIQEAIDKENELAAARKSILDEQIAAYGSLTESVSAAAQRNYAGMSAAEANQFGGFLDFIGGANEALAELRDTGAETSAEFAKINEMIQQANTDMYDGLAQSRLMLGDATGALAAAMRNSTLTFEQFNNEAGQFVAGAFNSAYLQEQARTAAGLYSQASASFLSIPNAGSVMGALGDVILTAARDELGVVARGTASDIAQNNTYIYDVVSEALMDKAGREAQMALPSGPGVASVMQAQATASASLATKYVPGFGNITGAESIAWAESMSALNSGLNAGKLSTNEFNRAVEQLNKALPNGVNAVELTIEQMADAVEGAARAVSAAGVESINYYFGQLSFMADDLAVAADSASQAIASVTNYIGLMNSAAVAFGISANAAGALGGGVTEKGRIVADAASLISGAMTTRQAAEEAALLADEEAFVGVAEAKIRDLSLMLEGVTAYDTEGLRNAFVRLSAALGEGALTQQQYAVMVNDSLDLYEDVAAKEAELAGNLKTVMDEFRSIADSARSLADDLLLSESSTLDNALKMEEAQRQYRVALAGAMDGDQDAMGDLSSITSKMLSLGGNTLSDRLDYQRMFATSIADIRGVETINDKRADEAAAQLAATNALKDEIAALREEIKAGESTIASNTDKTRKRLDEIATVGIKVIA